MENINIKSPVEWGGEKKWMGVSDNLKIYYNGDVDNMLPFTIQANFCVSLLIVPGP